MGNKRKNKGEKDRNQGRNTPRKAVYPINQVYRIGKAHNPEKGKGIPQPVQVSQDTEINKKDAAEGISGDEHQESRDNLDKQLIPGCHGPEIIKNPKNKDQQHRYQREQEGQMQIGSGENLHREQGNNHRYPKTYPDKGGRKSYAPQTGNFAGMNFPVIYRIVPGFLTGKRENLGDYDE
jgi:hypothetical protein